MQHRALLPAIFHRGVFDKLSQVGANTIAELIGELIFPIARILSRLIAQQVNRLRQTIHPEHRHKTFGINQPFLHEEAILKEM